jgi:uncharacterized membrane protein YagU involved in acid resistance
MSTNTLRQSGQSTLVRTIILGVVGGVVGGVVFGIMMATQGMMPMIAAMVGSQSDIVGWLVHFAISAFIGGIFGIIAPRLPASWVALLIGGVVWGIVWWVLGALILMPLSLGMNEMVLQIGQMQINSLIGHVVFGVIMAAVYKLAGQRM